MKVLILGGPAWSNQQMVRDYVQGLAPGTLVLTDGDPYGAQSAALRQCRCSWIVAAVFQLPSNAGKKVMEARGIRDQAMFAQLASTDRVVVFGDLAPDRELALKQFVATQKISVERIQE